jgi:hypothetical protein
MSNQTKCFSKQVKTIIAVFSSVLSKLIGKMTIETSPLDSYVAHSDKPTSSWLELRQKIKLCSHAPPEVIFTKIRITAKFFS